MYTVQEMTLCRHITTEQTVDLTDIIIFNPTFKYPYDFLI